MNQSPASSRGRNEVDPRVRLGETAATIEHEKRQGVIRIVTVLGQKRSAELALHGDKTKRWLRLVTLQPPGSATAEVAKTIEDDDAVFSFHLRLPAHALTANCATQPMISSWMSRKFASSASVSPARLSWRLQKTLRAL